MDQPQFYQYSYTASPTSFTARARGCRADLGSFALTGRVEAGRVIIGEPVESDWAIELGMDRP
jgi:hypothetical protein